MRILRGLQIEGFRSLREVELKTLSDFTALAGVNNTGKSNILRALNAFFNDETDSGRPLDVDGDYFRPDMRKKKKKQIRVSVEFELPDAFRFRKGLEGVRGLLGTSPFTLTKAWERGNSQPSILLDGVELGPEQSTRARQFLQLITYRYIPNRVLPLEVIAAERQSLRNILLRRLGKRTRGDAGSFAAIREITERMLGAMATRFEEACPGQGAPSLAVPQSWNDLAFSLAYRVSREGVELTDAEQGSGIQSLLMLETLSLIDRDYFQQFGWRQAAVWGLEEPESSMHTGLEARVAAYLAGISQGSRSRLQLLCTTHSDLVVQYATATVVTRLEGGETMCAIAASPREAMDALSSAGVSRWVPPILNWPLDPIVIVEGKRDREFLEEAFRFIRPSRRVRVIDPSSLGAESDGGAEWIKGFVKSNADAIKSRGADAPIVVVLDWDVASKLSTYQNLVKSPAPYRALAWPADQCNPRAGECFRGAERFHCDRVLEDARQRGAPIGIKKDGSYVVASGEYDKVKETIAGIVRAGLQAGDFLHAEAFVRRVLEEAGAA